MTTRRIGWLVLGGLIAIGLGAMPRTADATLRFGDLQVSGNMQSQNLVRTPDAQTTHAVELAALREELAETRELVDRVAQALERLAPARSPEGSQKACQES